MKNRALKYTIGFALVGVFISLLIAYVQRNIFTIHERNLPYLNLCDNIKHRTTLGHLRFEEAMSGDTSVNFEKDILLEFVSSRNILQNAYTGKISEIGAFYKADEDTRVLLKEAVIDADLLIDAVNKLNELKQNGSPDSPIQPVSADSLPADSLMTDSISMMAVPELTVSSANQNTPLNTTEFDTYFDKFQLTINRLSNHLKKNSKGDSEFLNTASWVSISLLALIFTLSCVLLYRLQDGNDKLSADVQARLGDQESISSQLSGFIEAVSSGNFNVELKLSGDDGGLTDKLITMRNTLKENAENERKRGFSTMGLAQIGEILRSTTTNSTDLYDNIIRFLVKYTKSNQGGLFVINDDDHEHLLELTACYAFERKKFLTKTLKPGEGLAGQCFLEGERILLEEVPDEYVAISSGLGGSKPKSILLVPMKLHDRIYGVIELATFTHYEDYEVDLVEKLAESIASAISSVRTNESTRILLEKTQQQAEEMKAQEEEIRQNMEELEATQEEMQRKQTALEGELLQFQQQAKALQVQERQLLESQETLQGIVDNVPRAIFWKDKELRFVGCNKLFARIAGAPEISDIIGKTDKDMPWSAHADAYRADDLDVLRSRKPKLEIEEFNIDGKGRESWVVTSKVPIIDKNNEVIAILGMFEDITERKKANAEIASKLAEREQALKEIESLKRRLEGKG
jgi:PAS domain S-box-containing protein